jgi:hypothetical protein
MKNVILGTFLGSILLCSCSKSSIEDNSQGSANVVDASTVPQTTRTAFSNDFSGASGVEWQRNNSSSFTVQFNHSNQRHDAGYDDNGHQSSHSIICLDAPVPEVILAAFRQQFANDNVYEWKLRNDGIWKAHFMRGTVKYEATFSATGSLLKFEKSS